MRASLRYQVHEAASSGQSPRAAGAASINKSRIGRSAWHRMAPQHHRHSSSATRRDRAFCSTNSTPKPRPGKKTRWNTIKLYLSP